MAGKAKSDLTKTWLVNQNFRVLVNDEDTYTWIPCKHLPKDSDKIEVLHYSKHLGWRKITPQPNICRHDKGIIKEAKYEIIGFTGVLEDGTRKCMSLPYHRFLYAWFNGCALAGYDVCHKDGDGFNNKLSNLKQDTHKNNLRERKGAVNQWWNFKRDEQYNVE